MHLTFVVTLVFISSLYLLLPGQFQSVNIQFLFRFLDLTGSCLLSLEFLILSKNHLYLILLQMHEQYCLSAYHATFRPATTGPLSQTESDRQQRSGQSTITQAFERQAIDPANHLNTAKSQRASHRPPINNFMNTARAN